MDTMPHDETLVTLGVDTHADLHVAVALDQRGGLLGDLEFTTDRAGYKALIDWACSLGTIEAIGIEGTGSWGRGLTLFCLTLGLVVREAGRPDRADRRRRGKTDLIDAETAARAVQAGTATVLPKAGDGVVEMIRILHITRETAVKARTQAMNQLRALAVTAPIELADELRGLSTRKLMAHVEQLQDAGDRPLTTPADVVLHTARGLAARIRMLDAEIKDLTVRRDRLVERAAPRLLDIAGVGHGTAAQLLITAGDNPNRLHSEAAFARLAGVAPIPVSSGRSDRVRLHRGGDRQANKAFHRIVLTRLRWPEQRTIAYVAKHNPTGNGKADPATIRRLKRYAVREVFPVLLDALQAAPSHA